MASYRLFYIETARVEYAASFEADSDREAGEVVRSRHRGRTAELWNGERYIAEFQGEGSPAVSRITPPNPVSWVMAVARCADRDSFTRLFEAYAPKVNAFMLGRGLSPGEAEEIAQETMLAVWCKASQFDPAKATVSAWIYTIARNLSIDAHRRQVRVADGRMAEPASPPLTPYGELEGIEDQRRVRAAMATLSPDQADVMRRSFFDDESHAEIADTLALPVGTVKSRIRLASAHMRLGLAPQP